MKLGIMQPYFFPYFQQFRHISQCDQWVLFDTVQYSRKTWVNRNRILDRKKQWSYVGASVAKGATQYPIADAVLGNDPWRERLLHHLRVYQHESPYFTKVTALVEEVLKKPARTIGDLNFNCLTAVCTFLGIKTSLTRLSEMHLDLPRQADPGMWAFHISRAMGASEYSNASGGRFLFNEAFYQSNGITLSFYEPVNLQYLTGTFDFVPDLSVIDTLMWLSNTELQLRL